MNLTVLINNHRREIAVRRQSHRIHIRACSFGSNSAIRLSVLRRSFTIRGSKSTTCLDYLSLAPSGAGARAGLRSSTVRQMAAVSSYIDRDECAPLTQAETAACSVLAEYVAPLEIVLKEWYMASYEAARNSAIVRSSTFPEFTLLAGSRADGLSLPTVLPFGSHSMAIAQSDYDNMFCTRGPRWHGNDGEAEATVGSVSLEPVATDPRYYRLVPGQEWRDELRRRHPSYDGGYLPHRYFVNPLGHGWPGAEVSVHGPAVSLNSGLPFLNQQDTVKSIQLDAWPAAIADDWLHRFRPSGWPDERLVRDLVDSEPLFLTPTGRSENSTDEAIEWRLSFSLPERHLALSLTAAQRTAYVLVKMLMKAQAEAESSADGGDGASSFRTFYLKNALFWACEAEPADTWQRPADGARALLARVERCSIDGSLPSYFVPASNLLDREPAEALLAAASRARQLSNRPLSALRFLATPRRSFVSLGIVNYGPLWRWVDAEAAAAKPETAAKLAPNAMTSSPAHLAEPASASDGERVLTFLFAAYASLLKAMESFLEASLGDRGLSLIARVTRSLIASVAARLAVDIYSHRRRQYLTTLGGGRYVLSRETSTFEAFARFLLEEHGIVSEDLLLHSRALLRIRLRGHDELSSGSFPPVTERHLRLVAAQCALTQPATNVFKICVNDICQRLQASSLQAMPTDSGHYLREPSLD